MLRASSSSDKNVVTSSVIRWNKNRDLALHRRAERDSLNGLRSFKLKIGSIHDHRIIPNPKPRHEVCIAIGGSLKKWRLFSEEIGDHCRPRYQYFPSKTRSLSDVVDKSLSPLFVDHASRAFTRFKVKTRSGSDRSSVKSYPSA